MNPLILAKAVPPHSESTFRVGDRVYMKEARASKDIVYEIHSQFYDVTFGWMIRLIGVDGSWKADDFEKIVTVSRMGFVLDAID